MKATLDFAAHALPFKDAEWFDILPRSLACPGLADTVLLHAGPPYRSALPPPVRNAAIQALLYEGDANSVAEAESLLADGSTRLEPAQDHGIATPLAQVVSRSMPLVAVRKPGHVGYAPIVEGPAPALRFGCADAVCRSNFAEFSSWAIEVLAPLVRQCPVALEPVILEALASGDECHARTGCANDALAARIRGLRASELARLRANPAFVLPVIMAAALSALRDGRGDIASVGGNGVEFGFRLHGCHRWRCLPADVPRGTRFAPQETVPALPAIGDSAVIDFCGLGAQALAAAPSLVAEWSGLLASDALALRAQLLATETGMVDLARIARHRISPGVNLAILDRDGRRGLIGRGLYMPPFQLFLPE